MLHGRCAHESESRGKLLPVVPRCKSRDEVVVSSSLDCGDGTTMGTARTLGQSFSICRAEEESQPKSSWHEKPVEEVEAR